MRIVALAWILVDVLNGEDLADTFFRFELFEFLAGRLSVFVEFCEAEVVVKLEWLLFRGLYTLQLVDFAMQLFVLSKQTRSR